MDDFINAANARLLELKMRLIECKLSNLDGAGRIDSAANGEFDGILQEYANLKSKSYEALGSTFLNEDQSLAILMIIGQCDSSINLVKKTFGIVLFEHGPAETRPIF
jgi:hypothetical protein